MKKSRIADEQIAFALRQAEGGPSIREIYRSMGVTEATYFRWRCWYGGLKEDQAKRSKESGQEDARPKRPPADAQLDRMGG